MPLLLGLLALARGGLGLRLAFAFGLVGRAAVPAVPAVHRHPFGERVDDLARTRCRI